MKTPTPRTSRFFSFPTLLLTATALALGACGGGGGGGGAGPGPADNAPTAAWVAPLGGAAATLGDVVAVTYTADDDDVGATGQVSILANNLSAPFDQTVLLGPINHPNGGNANANLTIAAPLAVGTYGLVLRIDDTVNAAVEVTLPQPLLVYPGVAGVRIPATTRNHYGVVGSHVVFSVGEQEDSVAGVDKNADGDMADGIVTVIDTTTGVRTDGNVAFDINTGAAGVPVILTGNGGSTLAWICPEAEQGNINPDGDATDHAIAYLSPGTSVVPQLNVRCGAQAIVYNDGASIVAPLLEAEEAADIDGDTGANDSVWAALSPLGAPATGILEYSPWFGVPGPIGSTAFANDGPTMVVFPSAEGQNDLGVSDLTGDGFQDDTVLVLSDLLTPAPGPNPLVFPAGLIPGGVPQAPRAVDPTAAFDVTAGTTTGHVAYVIDESAVGVGGAMVNGDADATDYVPAVWTAGNPIGTGFVETILATGAALDCGAGVQTMIFDGDRLFFTAIELAGGGNFAGSNNDGDGGTDTQVLLWADETGAWAVDSMLDFTAIPAAAALRGLTLDGGSGVTLLAPGWLSVIVAEGPNNNVDFNGNGLIDIAYLLVDTTTNPPAVHSPAPTGGSVNTGIVTSPSAAGTGNMPVSGVAHASGVVVRLVEGLNNGILNADADNTDTLFAYISFATPGTATVLDTGGDAVAIAGSRIAVTANESYTGVDLDGVGGAFTAAFRVYDLTGTVVLSGLPCALASIPAADDGTVWAYLRDEATGFENVDMNGDGDKFDLILGIWIP